MTTYLYLGLAYALAEAVFLLIAMFANKPGSTGADFRFVYEDIMYDCGRHPALGAVVIAFISVVLFTGLVVGWPIYAIARAIRTLWSPRA